MNNTILAVGAIVLIALAGFFVFADSGSSINGNVIDPGAGGDAQSIILSQDGLNYKDTRAEAGKPIKISADSSVRGCLRSLVFSIGGKRYSQYLKTPQESMTLPALEKGTYTFSCSMGMGYGKLIDE